MTEATLVQFGGQTFGATMSNSDPRTQAAAMLAAGVTSKLGVELPHGRAQETEADHIGLIYLARVS
jgi:predicted Zn-dependent protease